MQYYETFYCITKTQSAVGSFEINLYFMMQDFVHAKFKL